MDTEEVTTEFLTDLIEKAEAFDWLMTQMRGHSLHMDGKQWWSLPVGTLSKYPARTPQEAVAAAYAQYQSWVAEHKQSALECFPEPPFKDGELGPMVE
jgi:hypothetical protein